MPREILTLCGGQCGNQMGYAFWERAAQEHGLGNTGEYKGSNDHELEKIGGGNRLSLILSSKLMLCLCSLLPSVFFKESRAGAYVPRTVQFDLEPGVLDKIKGAPFGKMFAAPSFINAQSGAGNNWAKGHYTEGAELIDA